MEIPKSFEQVHVLIGKSVKVKDPAAISVSLGELFAKIADASEANTPKLQRWFFSQSLTKVRPKTTTSYNTWSGVSIVDLDIKNATAAPVVKEYLHMLLQKQTWYAGIVLSASHKGVHVYTACKAYQTTEQDYLNHLEAVSIVVWHCLHIAYELERAKLYKQYNGTLPRDSQEMLLDMHPVLNQSSRREIKSGLSDALVLDPSVFKLTQPAILGYDPEPLLNPNFELQPPLSVSEKSYEGLKDADVLKALFDKRQGRHAEEQHELEIGDVELPDLTKIVPRSYNNTARYRLAYTLANLYDVQSKDSALYKLIKDCFMKMCSGNPKYHREHKAFEAVFDSAVQRQATGMCPRIAWAVNELQTVHQVNIEVKNAEVLKNVMTDIDIDAELGKPVYIPPELQITYDNVWKLDDGQYIADATELLLSKLSKPNDKVLLIAEPGTGKTVFATNLMLTTKLRILCVVPYISVIESKFKTLPPEAQCQCCYAETSYDVTASRNAVMTFDKFSRTSINDLDACFDIIVLDESHLLQMSCYRGLVPAECIDRLRATKTPVVCMTGTPIAEHMFVTFTYKTMFKRNRATSKLFNVVICQNPADQFVKACRHISNAIRQGRRVIMPTNEGNSYVEKIIAAVTELLSRPVNAKYYKKEYATDKFMYDVNRLQTIGDIELLFCSSYLSVGVDINDIYAFDIVYTEDFTAHEIEQFNNRLRLVDLASYYFVAKYANDGYVRPNCYAGLSPNLRMSKIRQLELHDLLSLQTVKAEEKQGLSVLYDYVARHMQMPWLLRQPDGSVELHATCYSLWTFEDVWRRWSWQLPIIVEQLRSYNYQISIANTELLDEDEFARILQAAREGLHGFKDRVNADLAFVINLMQNKDFYDVIVYSNALRLVRQNWQAMHADDYKLVIEVQNVPQVFRFVKAVRMLSRYYKRETVLSLYNETDNSLSQFEQVYRTVELLDYASNDRLGTTNAAAVQYIFDVMFNGERSIQMSRKQFATHRAVLTKMYKDSYDLQASTVLQKIEMRVDGLIKRLAEQLTARKGETTPNDWMLRTIPAFDSSAKLNLEAQKALMFKMFQAKLFATNDKTKTSRLAEQSISKAKRVQQYDFVNLKESLQKLQTVTISRQMNSADKLQIMKFLQENFRDISMQTIKAIIADIDLTSSSAFATQAMQLAQTKYRLLSKHSMQ